MNLLHAALERIQRETVRNGKLAARAPNLMTVTTEIESVGSRIRQGIANLVQGEIEKVAADVSSNTSTLATVAQSVVDNVSILFII